MAVIRIVSMEAELLEVIEGDEDVTDQLNDYHNKEAV